MYASSYLGPKLLYREVRSHDDDKLEDIFDGKHFKRLLCRPVTWKGQPSAGEGRTYFDQATDIALGLSTDGIPLQTHTALDVWPLLLTVYSLGPEYRYRRDFQLCCGLIPGAYLCGILIPRLLLNWMHLGTKRARQGKVDFDSFMQPLLEELQILAGAGVECRRYLPGPQTLSDIFTLRAHLITVTGDMPAVSKVSTVALAVIGYHPALTVYHT